MRRAGSSARVTARTPTAHRDWGRPVNRLTPSRAHNSYLMRIISVAGLLVMAVGVVGLLVRGAILSTSLIGVVAQAAAVGLMIWARLTMGLRSFHATADPTDGGLVTSGPYRFIRHPIYTSICLFCSAAVLAHASPSTVVLGGLVVVGAFMRMTAEERLLVQRYPGFRLYASATKRMVPYVF